MKNHLYFIICLPLITFVFVVVILLQCAPHISGSLRVAALQNSPINTWPTLTRWILRHRCSNTCVSLCTSLSSIVHCCLSGSKLLTISVYKPARAGGWYPTDARFSVGSDSAVPELIGPALLQTIRELLLLLLLHHHHILEERENEDVTDRQYRADYCIATWAIRVFFMLSFSNLCSFKYNCSNVYIIFFKQFDLSDTLAYVF